MEYWRPIPMGDPVRPAGAFTLAGGWLWFDRIVYSDRSGRSEVVAAADAPKDVLDRLITPRAPIAGLTMDQPRLMGILNVTPDSFSDGGLFAAPDVALEQARDLARDCDILDIGGESTRPGAAFVEVPEEIARTAPIISAIREEMSLPISIDTRKAPVARAALEAGAGLVNDVAAFTFDPAIAQLVAESAVPCCLMHAQGRPENMQDDPQYNDVVLDVYDYLEERIHAAQQVGIQRDQIVVDPGIGFGKTLEHNLALLRNISIFHSLGCPILLGASRKRFIGTLANAPDAMARMPGSVAIALHGASQGVQFLRVHDSLETRQALTLQMSL